MEKENPFISYFIECNKKRIQPDLEYIQQLVNEGAILSRKYQDNEETPLMFAINYLYDPSIIQYLVDNGVDKNHTIKAFWTIYRDTECYCKKCKKKNFKIFDDTIVVYKNIKNILIKHYHFAFGSVKIINQGMLVFFKSLPISEDRYWFFDEENDKEHRTQDFTEKNINLLKEYCKILNIDFNSITTELLELPDNVLDFSSCDYNDMDY